LKCRAAWPFRQTKALREARPRNVRQFFAVANQHVRWELNDLARRLDERRPARELREGLVPDAPSSGSGLSADARRVLAAVDGLPEEEREVFGLVRVQGMTHAEAAQVLNVSAKTVQRRLNRSLVLLEEGLSDLRPGTAGGKRRAHPVPGARRRRRPGRNDICKEDAVMAEQVVVVTGVRCGIGRAVAFLALPDSDYITGRLLAVDGGYLAQGLPGSIDRGTRARSRS
jgi:RNA polymerase sigma factor (sigma-70 family)